MIVPPARFPRTDNVKCRHGDGGLTVKFVLGHSTKYSIVSIVVTMYFSNLIFPPFIFCPLKFQWRVRSKE
jgi:hypothetical protein